MIQYERMNKSTLEVAGIMLWWAEGTKSRRDIRWKNALTYPIEITNTNSKIICIFLKYLRDIIGVPEQRIRLQLQIHEGDNQLELESYWSSICDIPKERFQKTIVRPTGNKIGKSKGTCKIRFADKEIYGKLQSSLDNLLLEL